MTDQELTDAQLRQLADPVVVEADAAIRSIYAHLQGQPMEVADTVCRMFLMASVGVMKQAGMTNKGVAGAIRRYADMVDES
jgi:hypothetical protein